MALWPRATTRPSSLGPPTARWIWTLPSSAALTWCVGRQGRVQLQARALQPPGPALTSGGVGMYATPRGGACTAPMHTQAHARTPLTCRPRSPSRSMRPTRPRARSSWRSTRARCVCGTCTVQMCVDQCVCMRTRTCVSYTQDTCTQTRAAQRLGPGAAGGGGRAGHERPRPARCVRADGAEVGVQGARASGCEARRSAHSTCSTCQHAAHSLQRGAHRSSAARPSRGPRRHWPNTWRLPRSARPPRGRRRQPRPRAPRCCATCSSTVPCC